MSQRAQRGDHSNISIWANDNNQTIRANSIIHVSITSSGTCNVGVINENPKAIELMRNYFLQRSKIRTLTNAISAKLGGRCTEPWLS